MSELLKCNCNPAIPTTYSEALSYYEEVTKIAHKVNEIIDELDTQSEIIDDHIEDTDNPHEVTKAQVGLGNVDNTSDANKPISTATQTALNLKANSADVYTKSEVYTKTQIDSKLTGDLIPASIDIGGMSSVVLNTDTITVGSDITLDATSGISAGGVYIGGGGVGFGESFGTITNLANPTNDNDATNKIYVDGAIETLENKIPKRTVSIVRPESGQESMYIQLNPTLYPNVEISFSGTLTLTSGSSTQARMILTSTGLIGGGVFWLGSKTAISSSKTYCADIKIRNMVGVESSGGYIVKRGLANIVVTNSLFTYSDAQGASGLLTRTWPLVTNGDGITAVSISFSDNFVFGNNSFFIVKQWQ